MKSILKFKKKKKGITVSTSIYSERLDIIEINRKRCSEILSKDKLTDKDIIDALISLHLVLEIGLNSLYRNIISIQIKKDIDMLEMIKNIDNINFIDKTVMFIYSFNFNFKSDIWKAEQYHSIINYLRKFSEIRNLLLHGHTIMTINVNGELERESKLRKIISQDTLNNQIDIFKYILDGIQFYVDHLNLPINGTQVGPRAKKLFLNYNFLPEVYRKRDPLR